MVDGTVLAPVKEAAAAVALDAVCAQAQDMDDTAARVREELADVAAKKRDITAKLSAADRDVILWDQRLQQELDMQVI